MTRILLRPIDDLVEQVRQRLARAVEPLQVAAALEAEGLNDKTAREVYGQADVFALAEEVYARLDTPGAEPGTPAPRMARPLAQVAHGLLYAMPAALLPAASAVVGARWLMPGLVVTTGIGWVLGGVLARLAYGLAGRQSAGAAGQVLRRGLGIGLGLALLAALLGEGPPRLVVLCLVQMAFQISSGILLFYRREVLLALLMAPAVVAGVCYLVAGDRTAGLVAVTVGVLSVGAVGGCAVLLTLRESGAACTVRALLRDDRAATAAAALYTLLTAAFLLQGEARYVVHRPDLAIAGAGLVLGMGVLEYRAHRFEDEARGLVSQVCYPAEFTSYGHRLLLRNLLACLAALAALTLLPLVFLQVTGSLTLASVIMSVAHAILGVAYFVAFLLANQGRLLALCLAQGAALLVHPGARFLLQEPVRALADVLLFLAACLLFLSIVLVLMAHTLKDVWLYR